MLNPVRDLCLPLGFPTTEEGTVRRMRHPLSGAMYELADDGFGPVRVVDRYGLEGRFNRDGHCVRGPLFGADPELCRWIVSGGREAGGGAARSRRFSPISSPPATPQPELES